jgi:uncharacterized damage-inducible protein DinB
MHYEVCIEFDPPAAATRQAQGASVEAEDAGRLCPVRAWVPALPGCFCEAASEKEAVARLPAVVGEHLAWLQRHEEDVPGDTCNEVEVVERVEAPPGRSEPAFASDRALSSREDIELAIRRMAYARADLLDLVSPLPNSVIDWQPGPEKWSIRGILAHIASAEGYYRTSLLDEQPEREPVEARFDLELQREGAIAHLRSLGAEQREKVYHPNWPWRGNEQEEWTVRKALRRFIYHERFHTRDIEQTLAWLLTGGPEKERA